jgi:hypothetical protein
MPVGGNHGHKPPNPQHVPKSHGKKPPAPRPHASSGKSSSSAAGPIASLVYVIAIGVVLILGSTIAYLAHGYGAF